MAIELKDITKTFVERSWRTLVLGKQPKRVQALSGVSLTVQPGEVFGLLGPNGAGKTTLIKILATLILPDSGYASICGHDLCDQPHHVRSKIGLVNTSERSFYWRLTGRQNLGFFAALCNLSDSNGKKRVDELLDLIGLNEKADTAFMKYSTGQQQRLALARALLTAPEVLLMDEPTNSLDPVASSALRKLTRKELAAKQDKTVLWCTHNLKEAEEVCDRLAIIHKGKVIASGNLDDMQSLMDGGSSYQLKIDHWPEDALQRFAFFPVRTFQNNGYVDLELKAKEEQIPSVLKHLIGSGIKVYTCTRKETDLEEIFERLINQENCSPQTQRTQRLG
ncbi:MAG: ABC transporter ATP-binding protein [Desulfobacterales bacterium]|nr:ABC transporter ATP-binding protein [Desulfobacterales bacterium]